MLEKEFHDTLIEILSEVKDKSIALFISGGGDSNSILFALMELGIRPSLYTIVPPDTNEQDGIKKTPDYISARDTSAYYNLSLSTTILPPRMADLFYSLKSFIQMYNVKNKTTIETMYPLYLTFPKITEDVVITGLGADACFLEGRKANTIYKDSPDDYRDDFYKSHEVQLRFVENLAKQYHKKAINPFFDERIKKLFYGHTYEEVNKPHFKQAEYGAFKEQFEEMEKRHKICYDGMQTSTGGGMREHYAQLLSTPFNTKGYRNMIGIYNMIREGKI